MLSFYIIIFVVTSCHLHQTKKLHRQPSENLSYTHLCDGTLCRVAERVRDKEEKLILVNFKMFEVKNILVDVLRVCVHMKLSSLWMYSLHCWIFHWECFSWDSTLFKYFSFYPLLLWMLSGKHGYSMLEDKKNLICFFWHSTTTTDVAFQQRRV